MLAWISFTTCLICFDVIYPEELVKGDVHNITGLGHFVILGYLFEVIDALAAEYFGHYSDLLFSQSKIEI